MSFDNLQVDIDELPRAEEIQFQAMDPAYSREVRLQHVVIFVPISLLLVIPGVLLILKFGTPASKVVGPLLPALPLVLGVFLMLVATRRAKTAGYALREHDIAFVRGVFFRKIIVLPFHRVQHAHLSSGPLQRRFGLASLKLYTAGASGIDLQIDGLSADAAATLREHVITRSGGERGRESS